MIAYRAWGGWPGEPECDHRIGPAFEKRERAVSHGEQFALNLDKERRERFGEDATSEYFTYVREEEIPRAYDYMGGASRVQCVILGDDVEATNIDTDHPAVVPAGERWTSM